jgi:hypothetical protein
MQKAFLQLVELKYQNQDPSILLEQKTLLEKKEKVQFLILKVLNHLSRLLLS